MPPPVSTEHPRSLGEPGRGTPSQPPQRTVSGYRTYDAEQRERLHFIRHARSLGFSLDEIRELIALSGEHQSSCEAVDEIARRHLAAVQNKVAALKTMADELERMTSECAGGRVPECRILRRLGQPSAGRTSE